MKQKNNIWDELQNQPSKSHFKVPNGYFDALEDRIEAKIVQETEHISSRKRIIRMMKPVLAMAASFALVFLLVYYPLSVFLPNYLAKNADVSIEDTTTQSDDDLLFSYITISEQSVYDMFTNDEDEPEDEVSSEEMLDYLAVAMNETEIFAELKN